MARAISVLFAGRKGGGGPDGAAFVVAQVDDFRLRVADRIVVPGVSRFDWLLPNQVKPSPLSLTMVPKLALAITFTQGAGVVLPGFR